MKWLRLTVGSLVLLAAAVVVAVNFGNFRVRALEREVNRLEQERQRLLEYAQRLAATHRVGQAEILSQHRTPDGRPVSTVLWQEIGSDGALGRPLTVEIAGTQMYVEALVLKFSHEFVERGDAERGTSLALFRRIFGDQQVPESALEIDRATRPLSDVPASVAALHEELWRRFWQLIDDPKLASDYGVRVAQCEAPAVPIRVGQVWEVTIDAVGGLNLRKAGVRPPEAPQASP